jgi:hypothetical protein
VTFSFFFCFNCGSPLCIRGAATNTYRAACIQVRLFFDNFFSMVAALFIYSTWYLALGCSKLWGNLLPGIFGYRDLSGILVKFLEYIFQAWLIVASIVCTYLPVVVPTYQNCHSTALCTLDLHEPVVTCNFNAHLQAHQTPSALLLVTGLPWHSGLGPHN